MSRPAVSGRLLRDGLAVALGALTMLSLPPWGLWPLGPIGLGLWLRYCNRGAGRWRDRLEATGAFWLGAYVLGLFWMTELTVPGWIAAVPVEALIMALPVSLVAPSGWRRTLGVPAALVLGEAVRWRVPFGGVPMSNLALGQVEGPWLGVAVLAGPLGVIALVGVGAVIVERLCAREWCDVAWPAVAAIGLPLAALAWPATTVDATITAAVVQAGGELGTNVDTPQRSVRTRHLEATAAWEGNADLMLWSESSTSSDGPLEASDRLAELEALATERDLVLVANFYERIPDGQRFRNTTVAIDPNTGLSDRYDKAHLVPFGEYVPLRSVVERFADLSLISREAIGGAGPGLLTTSLGDIAAVTSYEVYFSELVRDGVRAGGRIVANPTLASSYSTSVVPAQSLASARLRAVESGRWVLQSSTTGYSAIVSPKGEITHRSELRESVVLAANVDLRSGSTPATVLGSWPLMLAAVVVLASCAVTAARTKRQRQ
ncbi:apolipoprotein N-acyltransferase [Candidatus Poriferisodalis sp.]|uniref:apolipoprotein N-acyltransferase n=1 Tax=Candidatus Poriferisodalis sp. TaxID=3101277 RepID=UPI003AF7A2E8